MKKIRTRKKLAWVAVIAIASMNIGIGQQPSAGPAKAPAQAGAEETPDPGPASLSTLDRGEGNSSYQGRWFRKAEINEVLQVLAGKAGYSFYENPQLSDIRVTARQIDGSPVEQMQQMAIQYGFTIYEKNGALFALVPDQVAALPRRQMVYKLKYVEPNDAKEIEALLNYVKPLLSANGAISFDAATQSIAVADNEYSLPSVRAILEERDQPKLQVVLSVKVLRISNTAAKRLGVDWRNTLGEEGLAVGATVTGDVTRIFATAPIFGTASALAQQALNTAVPATTTPTAGNGEGGFRPTVTDTFTPVVVGDGILITPLQFEVVLRALIEAEVATQESGPSLVVNDGDQAEFEVVEKFPIITQDVSQSNGENLISTNITYTIDEDDPDTVIGVKLGIQPRIRPDGTVWMKINPSVGTLRGFQEASTGIAGIVNRYPIVQKASVSSTMRVPTGFTLLLGGYYTIEEQTIENKVPFLGDIPLLGYAFSSKQKQKVQSNIVFAITPMIFNPADKIAAVEQTEIMRQRLGVQEGLQNYPDPENPDNADPDLARAIRNLVPIKPKPPADTQLVGVDEDAPMIRTPQQVEEQEIIGRVRRAQAVSPQN